MKLGLALPHYDFSVPGESPLSFATLRQTALDAEVLGFDSLWVSDHLAWSIEKYGGGPGEHFAYEPLTTLAALSGATTRVRLGTLVLLEALRPAAVLAKTLATLDRLSGGRVDVGIGAGSYDPDFGRVGLDVPPPGERLTRLTEAVTVLAGLLTTNPDGAPFTFDGRFHRAQEAINRPPAVQTPRPPIVIGGKGDRLLRLVAERADGWNTCWSWTPEAYRERAAVLDRACAEAGRDPSTVHRSLGLYTLVGHDRADLAARFAELQRTAPNGMLDGMTLDQWRPGRLVGTADEVADQIAGWADAGVTEIIVSAGPVPFSLSGGRTTLERIARAWGRTGEPSVGG